MSKLPNLFQEIMGILKKVNLPYEGLREIQILPFEAKFVYLSRDENGGPVVSGDSLDEVIYIKKVITYKGDKNAD